VSTFEWVLIGAFALYGVGLGLDLWRKPTSWERTFAACAIAATPAFIIEELLISTARPKTCTTLRWHCFAYEYVHQPVFVGAVVFGFIFAGAVSGRSFRGAPMPGQGDRDNEPPDA
jgi:hypothetical protein